MFELEPDFDFSSPLAIFFTVNSLILLVLLTVAEWRIFTKAGEKGWKSLIPFYSVFVSHHIIGMSHIWFILDMIFLAVELILVFIENVPDWLELWFGIVVGVFTIVCEIIHINKLCNAFGKKLLFKIGMFFLPQVFPLIIAFGSAKYRKPQKFN